MPTVACRDLVELAASSAARFSERPLFGERRGDVWQWLTYGDWIRDVDRLRAGLAALGVEPGERVAIISRNSAAWATAAYATYGLGAVFVPMYEAQRPEEWQLILEDCGAAVVICRTPEIAAIVTSLQSQLPALRDVLVIEAPAVDPRSIHAVISLAAAPVAAIHPRPDDVAGLIYTSGTTGRPKGVMLTHANLTSNVQATISAFPIVAEDRTVSFLPWAHVYGQVCELHILIGVGASTAFNTNTEHLLEDLQDIQPTLLIAVPRIFNKLHTRVLAQVEAKPRVIRAVFHRGIELSKQRRRGQRLGIGARVMLWFAGLLFGRIRRKLGGRLRYAISGSATLSPEVAELIDAIGIEVYEGYGLTETSPIVAFNRPGYRKFGSVGLPIDGVRVAIDQPNALGDGEIVVHGPNVMKGYYNRPDETARALTADGGLRTGDLGHVDADGYLVITGRLKEQYKLENGKYVMPSALEERLALSPFILQALVHGTGHAYNVALLVIDPAAIRAWASERGLSLGRTLLRDARVRALIASEVEREATAFRAFERPRDFVLVDDPFTVENGLLTPTLKIKRRDILARYGAQLEALYQLPPPIADPLRQRELRTR